MADNEEKKNKSYLDDILGRLNFGGETWKKGKKKMKSGEMEQPVDQQGRPIIIKE